MVLTASETKKLSVGDSAPDFTLVGIDGKIYTLKNFSAFEGFLVIFMCNHCPYVKAKTDDLTKLYSAFGNRVAMAGINSNDPEYPGEGMELMKAFTEERDYPRTNIALLNQALRGVNPPTSTTSTVTGPAQVVGASPLAQLAGAGLSAAALGKVFGARGGRVRVPYRRGGTVRGALSYARA